MRPTHQFKIRKSTGKVEFLNRPPFIEDQQAQAWKKERFSEIVPVNVWLMIAFRILRFVFGEDGACAAWTRQWQCLWIMTILQGNNKGVSKESYDRAMLLQLEREIWFQPKVDV